MRKASRSGVRDTPSRSLSSRSFSRAPGASSPSMIRVRSRSAAASGSEERAIGKVVPSIMLDSVSQIVYKIQYKNRRGMNSMRLNSHPSGRHFLQIPGPTNVPDRILRAMDYPTIDHRGPEFNALAKKVLRSVRQVFQTKQPVIVYPASGTGAWEAALVNTLQPATRC
jgi:hypothetical protein